VQQQQQQQLQLQLQLQGDSVAARAGQEKA
jgi:hypothetical protein